MDTFNIMTGRFWIIIFICVAGHHLSSSSPAPLSPLVVHAGQNVSLTCNTTSSETIWYLLRSDQLLPLLKVSKPKIKGPFTGNVYRVNTSRFNWDLNPNSSLLRLDILSVEEEDAGLYFCTGSCGADVCVNRRIHLKVDGIDVDSAGGKVWQPCWSLGICLLPALLSLCFCVMVGFYLCSAKLIGCCCKPQGSCSRVAEEESLHYSSLRHPHKPRPSGREASGLVEELVTYSTVSTRKNLNGRNHK